MRKWPVPHTVTEVTSFLGFANCYHQFLKGYASVVDLFYKLLSGENVSKKNRPVQRTKHCQEAFEKIKNLCCTAPILAFTDFKQPFILHTNDSRIGLGAVLYQIIDGQECVIGYGSCSLNKGESHQSGRQIGIVGSEVGCHDGIS